MVSKKILGVAIAAAMSAPAFAGADFNLAGTASYKVAKSSIADGSKVTIASPAATNQAAPGDYYVITKSAANAATLDLDVYGSVGIGLAADQKIYVRVELTNAAFNAAVAAGDLKVTDSTSAPAASALDLTDAANDVAVRSADTVSQGGAQKDKVVVFTVSPASGQKFEVADQYRLTIPSLLVTGGSDVGVKVTVHDTIVNAVNGAAALSTANNAAVVKFVDGGKVTFTPATVTADADTLFKKFQGVAYGAKTEVGNIVVATEAGVVAADGSTLSLDEVFNVAADKSILTLTGDFSNADYSINNAAGCGAVTQQITLFVANDAAATNTNNKTTGKANAEYKVALGTSGLGIAAADTTKTLTLCVAKQDNGLVLNATEFKSAIAFDKTATGAWAHPAVASTLTGTIVRNGVTVQVPYLTTFADYNQRLVLVNRGTTDAAYSIAFTPETGVTTTAGAAATGTLKANATTVLSAKDIVTVTGATRTAATITVVAADSKIDVATTSVNLSDKSTDTVKLK